MPDIFHLVSALHQTREIAAERDDTSGWRELGGRAERILATLDAGDDEDPNGPPAAGIERIDRNRVDEDTADLALASLMALFDRDDEDQLELALESVRDLEAAID